jgi:hypothetical protein
VYYEVIMYVFGTSWQPSRYYLKMVFREITSVFLRILIYCEQNPELLNANAGDGYSYLCELKVSSFCSADGDCIRLRNVGVFLPNYKVSQTRIQYLS